MNLSELNNLDFNDTGSWPPLAKGIAIVLVLVAVGAAGYYFDIQDQIAELKRVQQQEPGLLDEFQRKYKVMANIEDYRKQLEELQGMLDTMLQQLPTRTEMPDLLEDISNTGRVNGLVFQVFRPQDELPKDFYAAKPIQIRATGTYHQFAEFVSSVAALPRIVTLERAVLKETNSGGDALDIEATLQTYRYLESEGGS